MRQLIAAIAFAVIVYGPAAAAEGDETLQLCGLAHNVTAGARSTVLAEFGGLGDGETPYAEIRWPNEGLYGSFSGVADDEAACTETSLCVRFAGRFGDLEAAGFEKGAETDARVSIDFDLAGTQARGVYHLGLLPGYPVEQYGYLELDDCPGV